MNHIYFKCGGGYCVNHSISEASRLESEVL